MYLHFMIGLLAAGTYRQRADRHASGRIRHAPPPDLSALSDHELRDVGFLRERVRVPYRHLLWM